MAQLTQADLADWVDSELARIDQVHEAHAAASEYIGSRDTGKELDNKEGEVDNDLPMDPNELLLELGTADKKGGSRCYFATLFGWGSRVGLPVTVETHAAFYDDKTFDIDHINTFMGDAKIKQATWQFEICPETKKIHMHIVFKMAEGRKFTFVRTAFNNAYPYINRIHLKTPRIVNGVYDYEGCAAYCSKEASRLKGPFTYGKQGVKRGFRSDLDDMCDTIKSLADSGMPAYKISKTIASSYAKQIVLHPNGVDKLINLQTTSEGYDTLEEIIMCIGEPGSGKSHWGKHIAFTSSYSQMYSKNDNLYFCGYNAEPCLFFDEFTGWMKYGRWKDLCQPGALNFSGTPSLPRYNLAQSKTGALPFASKAIVFASNQIPTRWWDLSKIGESERTLTRRFTKIKWFGGEYKEGTHWVKDFITKEEMTEFWDFCKSQEGLHINSVYKNAADKWHPTIAITNAQPNEPFM